MTKKQQQIIGGGVAVCLLLFAAGFFLLVKPKKAQITTIKAQTASEDSGNATLRSQITMLQQQQAGLVGKQVDLQEVAQRIPNNAAIPALLRELSQIHTSAGVDIVSITPGAPTASAATVTTPVVATPTSTGAAATPAASSPATPAAATVIHPGASTGAVYQTIPITLSVLGDYSHMVIFLNKLEQSQRLYLVKSLTLAPGAKVTATTSKANATTPDGSPQVGDQLTATVTGEVYETSPDTTTIDLPALNGASTTGAAAPAATPSAVASAH